MLDASGAKSLAEEYLTRAWHDRDRLTLRLPPKRLGFEPGSKLRLPLSPSSWTIDKATLDGFVIVTELRPSGNDRVALAADAGRIVAINDVVAGPVSLALLDIPNMLEPSPSEPAILLAASMQTSGWKRRTVEIGFGAQTVPVQTARSKSRLGRALTALAVGGPHLIDDQNSVDVELIDADQWLTSCDDGGLAAGRNLAVLGRELIQFGRATPMGAGRFRLSHLLRGRGGSEWASASHCSGELFCVIEADALRTISLPTWTIGGQVTATITGGTGASNIFAAEALRPPSPVELIARAEVSGDLRLQWTRRSRQGFAWVDEIDAPLGETREQYRISIAGSVNSAEWLTDQPILTIPAEQLAEIGGGPAVIEVRQIGDYGASRPAQLSINLQ